MAVGIGVRHDHWGYWGRDYWVTEAKSSFLDSLFLC